jgi:NADP-dependent 3-hydroxy acid dehydrogenase YdfG
MPKKVILISGGSDGLGKAIAEKLAPNNHVIILSHNIDKLREVGREINCDFVEAELTDYDSLKTAVNKIVEKHHTLDVLVNNAGIWMEGELEDNEPSKIKELIEVNTTGTIFLTRAVLPGMRFRKSGQIINIISQDGLSAKKNRSIYHASKWAITGFTKCLQEDLEGESIKVTGVYPGLIKTNLFKKSGVDRDLSNALDPGEVASLVEYVINLNPGTDIPEVGITNKSQNMDNPNATTTDLNIDPNMIAAQDSSPQAAPTNPSSTTNPVFSPVKTPGVIDITPGSKDVFPTDAPITKHIDTTPLSSPKIEDITPSVSASGALNHLSDISPEPVSAESIPTIAPLPPLVPPLVPVTPNPIPDGNISQIPSSNNTAETPPAVVQSSPLAEDPDLVKLIK